MKTLKFILLTFALICLSSCYDNNASDTWVVGVSPDNPPYEFVQNGQITGFDIDLINEISNHLGKKIELKNMDFHSILAGLSTRNIDIAISGLSITPEREEKVDFSIPYFSTKIAVLYRADDKLSSAKDLKPSNVIGAQLGSTWNIIAHELAEKYDFKISSLSSNLMLVEDLKAGRVDAVILENSQATKFMEIYPNLSKFILNEFTSSFAIAMPKKSPNKEAIDAAIKILKNNGKITKLSKKWGLI